jgi:hypothetical protein
MKRISLAAAALALGATVVAVAAPASAVQFIQGFTWYGDGSFSKSGPAGTVVTVFATGAAPNAQFDLLSVPPDTGAHGCADFGTAPVNPNVRTSNSRGFIPNTGGPVNRSPGEYELCFYERAPGASGGHRSGTYPVFFTVV